MQIHTLRKTTRSPHKVRRGRGGKRGSFSGRGIKGQKARAGRRIRPAMRDVIMKIPKRRGHSQSLRPRRRVSLSIVQVIRKFKPGERITPKELVKRGLLGGVKGKMPVVKLVGPKAPLAPFIIVGCEVSKKL